MFDEEDGVAGLEDGADRTEDDDAAGSTSLLTEEGRGRVVLDADESDFWDREVDGAASLGEMRIPIGEAGWKTGDRGLLSEAGAGGSGGGE